MGRGRSHRGKRNRQVNGKTGVGDNANRVAVTTNRFWQAAKDEADENGTDPVLAFFGSQNPYPYSNHALVPTRYKGKDYRTSEHAYLAEQARAYGLQELADLWTEGNRRIFAFGRSFDCSNPKHVKAHSTKAFRAFKDPSNPKRKHWLAIRDTIMFQIVLAKFKKNRAARKALLESGHRFLVEASPSDAHWGIGSAPTSERLQEGPSANPNWGKNRLGMILMGVRNIIRHSIRTRKEITDRHSRRLVKRALQLYEVPQHQRGFYYHFRRQLVPAIRNAAKPKRRCLKTDALPPVDPLWRLRKVRRVTRRRPLDSKYLSELCTSVGVSHQSAYGQV